jgi:hypothetical protein
MQTKQLTAAYDLFVAIHADYTDTTVDGVKASISPDQFEERLHSLYQQYAAGEFSVGRFTELIGVPHWELWQILDMLGLPVHN